MYKRKMTINCCLYHLFGFVPMCCGSGSGSGLLGHLDPGNTGSRSFIHKKTPVILTFSLYKFLKYCFVKIIFFTLILSVIRCLDLVWKCYNNYLFTSSEDLQGRTVNFYQEFTFPSVFETFVMKFHPERKRGVQFHQKSRENRRESKFQVKYSSPKGNSRYK